MACSYIVGGTSASINVLDGVKNNDEYSIGKGAFGTLSSFIDNAISNLPTSEGVKKGLSFGLGLYGKAVDNLADAARDSESNNEQKN